MIRIGDFKINDKEKKIILDVLESGRITEGIQTKEFEKKWANKIGTKYSVAVNSGTSALISGLYALKYLTTNNKKRKKVITTPLTYIATSNAIRASGLEPVYGDINRETFSIMPSEIEKILNENDPKKFLAILPVHLMGYPCDMNKINQIAEKNNLFVFEDAAQAHGSKYNGKTVGSLGDLSAFSFYIAHNLQVGELGAINTDNLEIKKLIKQIKSNGRLCCCDVCRRMQNKCPYIIRSNEQDDFDPRFTHNIIGFNFKTMDIVSALANTRINELDEINNQRRENILFLNEGLKKYKTVLQLPLYSEDVSYLGYPIIVKKGRGKIRKALEERGIETRPLFGCIPTQQPSFADLRLKYEGKLPNAEYIGRNGMYIGCHQYLSEENLKYIVESFSEILKDE